MSDRRLSSVFGLVLPGVLLAASAAFADATLDARLSPPGDLEAPVNRFGVDMDIDGDLAVIGAVNSEPGGAFVFERVGGVWTYVARLDQDDLGDDNADFAESVAIQGTTIAVGAPSEDDDGLNGDGAIYIFERIDGTWTKTQRVITRELVPVDGLGDDLVLTGDLLISGTPFLSTEVSSSGGVRVFRKVDGNYELETTLIASDAEVGDFLGEALAFDDDRLVVGWDRSSQLTGGVYVFDLDRPTGEWTEVQKLVPADAADQDNIGFSVGIDGDWIAIGAPGDDGLFGESGAVYLYRWDGESWTEAGAISAADTHYLQGFGFSLAMDADRLVVGAWGDNDAGVRAGAAYLYEPSAARGGPGWDLVEKILPLDVDSNDRFGSTAVLDGATLFVGAYQDEAPGSDGGAVYAYSLPSDVDGDGVLDGDDNCPDDPNPQQEDADADGIGDVCDPCLDVDGDGYGTPGDPTCDFPETDCDDGDPVVNPGAVEVPGNGIDDDCDPGTPSGCNAQP